MYRFTGVIDPILGDEAPAAYPLESNKENGMASRITTYLTALIVIALVALPGRAVAHEPAHQAQAGGTAPMYRITDLGTLGGSFSVATAINNRGQIVGGSFNTKPDPTTPGSSEARAFLWNRGVMTDLGTLGGPDADRHIGNVTGATGIDDKGQIVGGATYNAVVDSACGDENGGEACNHAFLWAGGKMTSLGTLGGVSSLGNSFSIANAINAREQVVGFSFARVTDPNNPGAPQVHAFLWSRGVMTDLGTLPRPLNTYAQALGINGRGQIVGESGNRDGAGHPFFWSKGVMTDIGTLGGPHGVANALNNKGQVVGLADTTIPDSNNASGVSWHAFLWAGGKARDLGTYGKDPGAQANGINNRGQIVGFSGDDASIIRALLWQNGAVIDLNTRLPAHSGWKLTAASAINDQGQIVGDGVNPHARQDAYLLTPIHG